MQAHSKEAASDHSLALQLTRQTDHHSSSSTQPILHQNHHFSAAESWHFRLGHLSFDKMRCISLPCDKRNHNIICSICPRAKLHRQSFPLSSSRASRIFELVHVDIWGAYKCTTYNGYKYFLTIVDDYSRATWIHLMSTKSNAFPLLQSFVTYIENQFGLSVKTIITDNGLEFKDGTATQFYSQKRHITPNILCRHTPTKWDC